MTLRAYAATWLAAQPSLVKPGTAACYGRTLRHHVLPTLGEHELAALERAHLRDLVLAKRADGLAAGTVRLILAVTTNVLSAAVEDGLLASHPGHGLGRRYRRALGRGRHTHVLAMTADQCQRFLAAAVGTAARYHAYFLTMARAGLRPGEAAALQAADLDFAGRLIHVARTWSLGRIGESPKGNRDRYVDMSHNLAVVLGKCARSRPDGYLFATATGRPWGVKQVASAMRRATRGAGLPPFSPKALRHTFASRLIAAGVSPAYVQRQLGHASIQLTVDLYGRWLPMRCLAAVDALDDPPASTAAP